MTQQTNPHSNASSVSKEALEYAFLQTGRVTASYPTEGNGQHHVKVQETAAPHDQEIPVIPQVHGDYYVPPETAPVLVAATRENDYHVIGAPLPAVETETVQPGERIVSHPLSSAHVKFNEDGSLDISGDEEIRINDGDTGIITDVNTTTADGYVTSVSVTRDSNIKI